jgi:hypothetical protein
MGGGNQALCGSCHYLPLPQECDTKKDEDDAVCGANDNLFSGNYIKDVTWECSDCGAFNTCGQSGTGYTNRGNIVQNCTFENVKLHEHHGVQHVHPDEPQFGNQVVAAVYLDDLMSSWTVVDSTFVNVGHAVLLHGECTRGRSSH